MHAAGDDSATVDRAVPSPLRFDWDVVFVLDPLDRFEDADDVVWAKDREIRRVHEPIVQATTTPATSPCS